jgi:F-type H+-transporting ATPase subunit b
MFDLPFFSMTCPRRVSAVLLLTAGLTFAATAMPAAQAPEAAAPAATTAPADATSAPQTTAAPESAAQAEPAGAQAEHAAAEAGHEGSEAHEAGWLPTIAKVVNFAALAGLLAYFLRTPLSQYLVDRHGAIRRDLTEAQSVRAAAEAQLVTVRARLAELPDELRALEARGREELAHERERMKAATAAEREKLLERTRREVDLQFRVARRDLLEHTAGLAMSLARTRIAETITPDDQARLVDRYAAEVHS